MESSFISVFVISEDKIIFQIFSKFLEILSNVGVKTI
jgi:hypothetical protein